MLNKTKKHVLIIAGEASGDLHGANLVRAMKRLSPGIDVQGVGGRNMEDAGVKILVPSSDMAVVGLTEVFSKLYSIMKARHDLKILLRENRPDLLILIDYPEFNIHLAGAAKRYGIPVLYYISPQIWAWRRGRLKKIAGRIDRMAVILPFEKEFYLQAKTELVVDYVGHPLLDIVPDIPDNRKSKKGLGMPDSYPILGLLPGSRNDEIRNHLPLMINAAEILSSRYNKIKCVLPMAPTVSPELIESTVRQSLLDISVSSENIYRVLSICHFAFVASGTATLETALMEVPMVIVYRVSPLSYWIGKRVIKVPYVGLVNLIAGKEVVPELIQDEATPQNLAQKAMSVLENEKNRTDMVKEFRMIRERLGSGGASERTANIALKMLEPG